MTDPSAAEALNDLIEINNERIRNYERLIRLLDAADKDLRYLFARLIGESHQNKIMLATEVHSMGAEIDLSPVKRGKIFLTWKQNKVHHENVNRNHILQQSESDEEVVLQAYEAAINVEDVAEYLRDLLQEHRQKILTCRSEIKMLRDQTA